MSIYKFCLIIFLFVIGSTFYVLAQPVGSMNTNTPDWCDLPECRDACAGGCETLECLECLDNTRIPLDGGLLWLLLAGAGYGVKKIVDHRKKQQVL
jgi:hypothetical protein